MTIKSSNLEAIARATGKPWDLWLAELAAAGANQLAHKPLASLAFDMMPAELSNPGWWAQSVAIAYEQHIGRRIPGQSSDGSFKGSVSKTLNTNLDTALERWLDAVQNHVDFNGTQLEAAPTVSGSDKWRYWKAKFSDGSRVNVSITMKGDKASVSADHAKLPNAQALEGWKAFWRQFLAMLSS